MLLKTLHKLNKNVTNVSIHFCQPLVQAQRMVFQHLAGQTNRVYHD